MRRLIVFLATCAALVVPVAAAAQERYAVLVEGVSGTPEYATQHRQWLDALAKLLHDKFEFDAAHVRVLAEDPKAGEQPANADAVKATFKALAGQVQKDDLVFVCLIGHGTASAGSEAKFNLVGPDLDASEWAALVAPLAGRLVFVDTTSASAPFLKALAGPNRVVIVAADLPAMRFHTMFPEAFIAALQSPEADLDKDGRTSIWEAFTYASSEVQRTFQQQGTLQTERASLDDDGDGTGREATATTGTDGSLAKLTFLDPAPSTKTNDPELKKLLQQQEALTQQIEELKRKQSSMPPDAFSAELERLTTELAVVSREIRRRGGGPPM